MSKIAGPFFQRGKVEQGKRAVISGIEEKIEHLSREIKIVQQVHLDGVNEKRMTLGVIEFGILSVELNFSAKRLRGEGCLPFVQLCEAKERMCLTILRIDARGGFEFVDGS